MRHSHFERLENITQPRAVGNDSYSSFISSFNSYLDTAIYYSSIHLAIDSGRRKFG